VHAACSRAAFGDSDKLSISTNFLWAPVDDFWKVATTAMDMPVGAGVGTIGPLLVHKSDTGLLGQA
jgi:hypothetical protein